MRQIKKRKSIILQYATIVIRLGQSLGTSDRFWGNELKNLIKKISGC